MVLYDPKRTWAPRGACRWADPEMFYAPGWGQLDRTPPPSAQARWDRAKLVCARCPVLEECRRDTLGEEYGVWGGLDEHQRYLERKRVTERKLWRKWPEELRLEWGKHLAQLYSHGFTVADIRKRTGLQEPVVIALVKEWEASKAAPEAPAPKRERRVKVLPPVEFPEAPGQRHGWARNGRRIHDGWYAGHTSDGAWVRMQIFTGRGNAFKFFQPADVRFYNPQRRYIVPYFGRPDAADVQEDAHAA